MRRRMLPTTISNRCVKSNRNRTDDADVDVDVDDSERRAILAGGDGDDGDDESSSRTPPRGRHPRWLCPRNGRGSQTAALAVAFALGIAAGNASMFLPSSWRTSSASSNSSSSSSSRSSSPSSSLSYMFDGSPLPFHLDEWPELWSPSPPSRSDSPDADLDPAPPVSSSPELWDGSPGHRLRKFGGHTPHSVRQPFSREVVDELFGETALSNARRWAREGRIAWCGSTSTTSGTGGGGEGGDPDEFNVRLLPRRVGTARVPYACPNNSDARAFVEQGVTNRYAFNDNDSYCSFRMAVRLDPSCVLAHLGVALSLGPNVNYGFVAGGEAAYDEILSALRGAEEALTASSSKLPTAGDGDGDGGGLVEVDRAVSTALLDALRRRYLPFAKGEQRERVSDYSAATFGAYVRDAAALGADYADAMLSIHEAHPEDDLVAMIAVGALMQSPAWSWWEAGSDYHDHVPSPSSASSMSSSSPPLRTVSSNVRPRNARANQILEAVLSRDVNNLGANHYLIHSLEGGPHPSWAQSAADRLQRLDPTAGHVQHTSTHVYQRTGEYLRSVEWNKRANAVDFAWALDRAGGNVPAPYYMYEGHNVAFQTEAAMHAGNWAELASSIALHNRLSAFRTAVDPTQLSHVARMSNGYLYPLRFGMYEEVLRDLDRGPVDRRGRYEHTEGEFLLTAACLQARRHAEAVAAARLGRTDVARKAIAELLAEVIPAAKATDRGDEGTTTTSTTRLCREPTEACVVAACDFFLGRWEREKSAAAAVALTLESEDATGTATVNNGDALRCLNVLVPFADLLVSEGELGRAEDMLRRGWEVQRTMTYDEPSTFYYPIVTTLGKVQLMQNRNEDAAWSFRSGLFTWPRSVHLAVGLHEALRRMGGGWDMSLEATFLRQSVFVSNDTVIEVEWL